MAALSSDSRDIHLSLDVTFGKNLAYQALTLCVLVLALIEHHLIYLLRLGYDLPVLLDPGLQFRPWQKRELSENNWNFIHQKLSISVYTSHLHAFSDTWTTFRFYFS